VGTGRRTSITVAAGFFLGLATLAYEDPGFPSAAVNAAIDAPFGVLAAVVLLLAPLVVRRWWVVLAMIGPAVALLIMQAAGVSVTLDDGTGPAINYRTIFLFVVSAGAMLIVLGLRSMFTAAQSDQPG
jgi:hypothetical protein